MANFNLPVGADPNRDTPWGTDELGFPQFRTASGTIYSSRPQVVPQRQSQPGTMDRAIEVAKGYVTDALQGLLGAATAPRRALEGGDGVTPADALNLAGLLQLGGAASPKPAGALGANSLRVYHGTDANIDRLDPAYGRTARDLYTTPIKDDAAKYGRNILEFDVSGNIGDFRPDTRTREATKVMRKVYSEHGLSDYFDNFDEFVDAFDNGDLYQRFGNSRAQDDIVAGLLDEGGFDAIRIPDAGFGGAMSESVVARSPDVFAPVPKAVEPVAQAVKNMQPSEGGFFNFPIDELSANRDATTGLLGVGAGGFEDYLSRVNPRNIRVDANDRPNLMMGDMYGMLPRGSRKISQKDGVTFHRGPDGDYYATAYNPDVGEQDVVGYIMPRGDMTELAVVNEMQGKGIGSQLQYLLRRENPNAPTGGLTEGGEAALRKTYDRLVGEGILSANRDATAAAIALPVARNESEAMARRILEMRAAGRAGEVTDAMMAQADPQYMFANTPLPMDEASRMARAQEMGFDTDAPLFHGTDTWKIDAFDPSKGMEGLPATFFSDSRDVARSYGDVGEYFSRVDYPAEFDFYGGSMINFNNENVTPGGLVRQVKQVVDDTARYGADTESDLAFDLQSANVDPWYADEIDAVKMRNVVDSFGWGGSPANNLAIFDPTKIRRTTARFDPAFSHLSNLNAANVSPEVGLLATQPTDADKEAIMRYLGAQGLLR